MIKYFILILSGAGLLACSSVNTISVTADEVPVTAEYEKSNRIDSIISPYRVELESEMLEVIAHADSDFTKNRPNGSLNNWSADAIFNAVKDSVSNEYPIFCLLNVGGLRNPISKGDVLLQDIYKLMPFDNEIVIVKMPISSLVEIESYLKQSGGEPISGINLLNGKFEIDSENQFFWIVTSDYLFNGGDKMYFFEKNSEVIRTGILMRDAMILEAKSQANLVWNDEERITF